MSPINGKDITLNKEGKISGLSDGKIEASSTEVITGNQIYELGKTHFRLKVTMIILNLLLQNLTN